MANVIFQINIILDEYIKVFDIFTNYKYKFNYILNLYYKNKVEKVEKVE